MTLSAEYLAALIDGEGYVGIVKFSDKRHRVEHRLTPYVQVAMTQANDLLEEIASTFHGWLSKDIYRKNNRPIKRVTVAGHRNVKPLLNLILPHLRVKKRQAVLVLKFIINSEVGRGYNDTTLKRQIEIYNELRLLNHRGLGKVKGLLSIQNIRSSRRKKRNMFTKEELEELYYKKGLLQREIAELKGCSRGPVSSYLGYYKMRRTRQEVASRRPKESYWKRERRIATGKRV